MPISRVFAGMHYANILDHHPAQVHDDFEMNGGFLEVKLMKDRKKRI